MPVELTDECDTLLIGGHEARNETRSINNFAAAAVSEHNNEHEPAHKSGRGLTDWLSDMFTAAHNSRHPKQQRSNRRKGRLTGTSNHLAAMSGRLYDEPRRARHVVTTTLEANGRINRAYLPSEAIYDILDDEQNIEAPTRATEYSLETDGFEPVAGRKSPNYPFYNLYHQTLSSHQWRRKCRLFGLVSCLLILLYLSIALLIQLIVLIQQQEQQLLAERGGGGGRAWTEVGPHERHQVDEQQLEAGRASRWLVSSPKCHIPTMDPWHESIRSFVRRKEPLNCKKVFHESFNKTDHAPNATQVNPLTFTQDNRLHFTGRAIKLGYLNQKCCYTPVRRGYENDDDLVYDEKCYVITKNAQPIQHDLIKVLCREQTIPLMASTKSSKSSTKAPRSSASVSSLEASKLEPTYRNVHSFLVRDLEEEEALDRVAGQKLNRTEYYNVVMIGVDTISRLNGYRQLNETLSRLKSQYGALEFHGYNKVGENTFPNLVPFLTGLKPEQLTQIQCWLPSNYSQSSERGDDFMDNCKYLWNYYQDLGYITYFSEDWPKASTFNYLKPGFRRQPTTFYGRPFTVARNDLLLPPVNMGCAPCLLDRPLVGVDLDNLQNFITAHKDRPHFAFHWVNCPQHDDLNGASMVDSIFDEFFAKLKPLTHDDRTFVLFLSDHGYRWNDFVSTRVGHYESSLPLLAIAPPKRFIQRHPGLYQNLKRHQSALLTPFDLFKTLIAIRDLAKRNIPKPVAGGGQKLPAPLLEQPTGGLSTTTQNPLIFEDPQYTSGPTAATTIRQLELLNGLSYKQSFRTVSLLDANNSTQLDRSCIEAGIPDNYCVCHEFEPLANNKSDVLGAAYYLVYVHYYHKIKDHQDQCHLLHLERIHKAELFDFKQMQNKTQPEAAPESAHGLTTPPSNKLGPETGGTEPEEEQAIDEQRYLPSREYSVRVSTKPGGGLFQEVVRYYGQDDMIACTSAIDATRSTIDSLANGGNQSAEKIHKSVLRMNEACRFRVNSDSISRLNLYKDQSRCVKSNIELKKICHCNDLPV